jgi:hypothetical protein
VYGFKENIPRGGGQKMSSYPARFEVVPREGGSKISSDRARGEKVPRRKKVFSNLRYGGKCADDVQLVTLDLC